ncbi:MAG: transglycosylase SLT domain-containing protein, partial [Candidatus Sericytochromatia bacterium]
MRNPTAWLLLCLALTGCYPRLAQYEGEVQVRREPVAAAPERPQTPTIPFEPAMAPIPVERITAFIVLTNPYLGPDMARRQAELIVKHANEKGVPVNLVVSLIATESSFNPRAVSPVGAQGLGQLMPPTARDMGVNDPFDVEQNIHGTTRYLAWLGKQWADHPRKWELVLASYL